MDSRDTAFGVHRRILDLERRPAQAGATGATGAAGADGAAGAAGDTTWDSILAGTVSTASNVQTTLLEWTMTPNTAESAWVSVEGKETQAAFNFWVGTVHWNGWLYAAGSGAGTLSTATLWGGTSGGLSVVMNTSGDNIRVRVTGALGQPANWRATARRRFF